MEEKTPDEAIEQLLSAGSDRPQQVLDCAEEPAFDVARLIAYRRGALAEDERADVETHLIACPYCRDLAGELVVGRPVVRWRKAVVAVVAVAASLVFYLVTRPDTAPGPYVVAEVRGQIAVVRSAAASDGRTFHGASQVAIKVEPSRAPVASSVVVFRLVDGVLVPVAAKVEPGASGVFWVRGSGVALFGDTPGPKQLVLVAGGSGVTPADFEGRALSDVRANAAVRIVLFDARYAP